MASEKDLELLDDYISNRMDAADRGAFEKKIEGDPGLKSELQLQNKIADSLRAARATQLKSMLAAIPTANLPHSGGETSIVAKVGLWIAAAAVVGAGVYFLTNNDEPSETAIAPVAQSADTTAEPAAPEATPSPEENQASDTPAEQKAQPETTPAAKPAEKTSPARKDSGTAVKDTAGPKINAFDPSEEESTMNTATNPETAVIESTTPVVNKEQTQTEIITGNKKYNFHYQFKNGKVLLYGPFQANLYEIMEFFGGPQQTVFLFHESVYYMMTNDGEKIKPLQAIKDTRLIRKLDESRQIK